MTECKDDITIRIVEESYNAQDGAWRALLYLPGTSQIESITLANNSDAVEKAELKWFLEEYALREPFAARRAASVRENIARYQRALFQTLNPAIQKCAGVAAGSPASVLRVEVEGKGPNSEFQNLAWEVLEDEQWDFKELIISRVIGSDIKHIQSNPGDVLEELNILFLTARPGYHLDVNYRLISRPLVELLSSVKSGCKPQFVRPGSWECLVKELENRKNHYHIVHFDVHGEIRDGM